MIGRSILLTLGVCAVAAALVPNAAAPDTVPAVPMGQGPQSASLNAATQAPMDWYAGDHTLQRQPDGHFYADTRIGGTPLRMMVDTGASVIALTGKDAMAAGIHWDDADIVHVGNGASGAVFGVNTTLDDVELDGIVRRNVRAVIIPSGLDVSLLGQSFLSQVGSVEIAGGKMVLNAQ